MNISEIEIENKKTDESDPKFKKERREIKAFP